MTDGFQKKIKFPDHPMKVGESFTQGLPFNMPITDSKLKIDAKTVIYAHQKAIADGFAYFDLKPDSLALKKAPIATANYNRGWFRKKWFWPPKDNFGKPTTPPLLNAWSSAA